MAALRRILVPIDGSPPALAALDHAIALSEDGDARIDVLHVEPPDGVDDVRSPAPSVRGELDDLLDAAIERAQDRVPGRVVRRTVTGDPVRTIVETASDGGYDLIVIGTHGRVGRLHALLGSVAEGVVRNAPCPVLTVREPGGEYQSFAERRHGRPSLAEQAPPHPPR